MEYDYITLKCRLSEHDRRSAGEATELVDTRNVDYFENLCLKSKDSWPCCQPCQPTPPLRPTHFLRALSTFTTEKRMLVKFELRPIGGEGCKNERDYRPPDIGVQQERIAHHVGIYFYVDKELLVRQESPKNLPRISLDLQLK